MLSNIKYSLKNNKNEVIEHDLSGNRKVYSFQELLEKAEQLARNLQAAGLPERSLIGLRANNSVNWIIWDLACLFSNYLVFALEADYSVEDVDQILKSYSLSLLVAENIECKHSNLYDINQIDNRFDSLDRSYMATVENNDLYTRVFSSGTTGKRKGLNISRLGTEGVIDTFNSIFHIDESDRLLLFLPLYNFQQRMLVYACILNGASILISPYQKVFQTMKEDKPTFMVAPPVFYETYAQLNTSPEKLYENMGGKIHFLITGMAKIKPVILEKYWEAGLKLYEAYALTETGIVSANYSDFNKIGSVGKPVRNDISISDDGEVIINREFPLTSGYFEISDSSDETYAENGDIKTGDYGYLDEDGFLWLHGRKKEVIVSKTGQKFHPSELEKMVTEKTGVDDLVVFQSEKGGIFLLVKILDIADFENKIRNEIAEINKVIAPFMRINEVLFTAEELLKNPDFMTSNMKLKRNIISEKYNRK